jgi:NAD(P)-dependent dehydrogenase (short-subunit alcohol dehydrogenase family)
MSSNGKTAIVTGAGSGIGRATALALLASVQFLARENERTRFNHAKTERELGVRFRPFDETLADVVSWYRDHGDLPRPAEDARAHSAREAAASTTSHSQD